MKKLLIIALLLCNKAYSQNAPHLYILGIAQDGGYPHAGCEKKCCQPAWKDATKQRYVVSFALVSPAEKKWWLFEATPDIKEQLQLFRQLTNNYYSILPDGIFITHAHIGHYAGLMQLGREVMGAKNVKVYVLPKMRRYLETNGPWSQLVSLSNITLQSVYADSFVWLTNQIEVVPFLVPHRDEYSETAGFRINTGSKKYLFIPDIDKWEKWKNNIINEVTTADVAMLDATFSDAAELPNRNIKEVPHPLVTETIQLFKDQPAPVKNKIYFIHFNHTNPLLWNDTLARQVNNAGYHITIQGQKL
jgi:pyrroloquinoline quinone biosynthesis protein B